MPNRTDKLQKYHTKRDFGKTKEPRGKSTKKKGKSPRFVIQKHDASSLHYDFRLEFDGVLVSWAVPKGPSTDPHEKRLAVQTEDHPLEYADFEGVIPEGEYGAGTVMVWDRGTYRNISRNKKRKGITLGKAIDEGHFAVWLEGEKISGGYALTRMRNRDGQWLLVKMDDEHADARRRPTSTQTKSVISGRTMHEIAKDE